MRELLHKICSFRSRYGTMALIRLILQKLKNKATSFYTCSPEMATLPATQGQSVSLTKKEVKDVTTFRFEACSPLRVYSTPPEKHPRVSLVTDSINSGSLFGGVGTAIILAAMLAEAKQARLRIITRTERSQPENLEHVLNTYGIVLSRDLDFVFAPFYDHDYEFNIFDNELFITSSWWTTAATMASVPHDSIVYLLQEDERMFYPHGDDHFKCSQVLHNRDIHFVVNTQLLFEHFAADGFDNIAEKGVWFEPAFPKALFYPRSREISDKRTLMFYARPNNLRNLFYFGIGLIEEAVTRGTINLSKWDILLIGKDIPEIYFAGSYTPERRENLSWSEYAELTGKIDLGLCLMYTPHPSYPPLDLAASGAVVVTNRFGIKNDLGKYSRNIICSDLDQESMLTALEDGIRMAECVKERTNNYTSTTIASDWKVAFSDIINRFSEDNHAVS